MSSLAVRVLLFLASVVALIACASRGAAPEVARAAVVASAPASTAVVGGATTDAGTTTDTNGGPSEARPGSAVVAWDPEVVLGAQGKRVCSGHAAKETPHTAACCYPAREAILVPIRAIHASLRTCYEALPAPRAEALVGVKFHVGKDGHVDEACADETNDVPAALTKCVVEAFREARYPAMSAEETKLCGLLSVSYPVRFSP